MTNEDKNTLLLTAEGFVNQGFYTEDLDDILQALPDELTDKDCSKLIQFIRRCQKVVPHRGETLSIRFMKEKIMKKIGVPGSPNSYAGSTMSRNDVLAIYEYICIRGE